MTWDRKLLIVTGATLIALFVTIAAFSLGVYVGVHGWTAGPPAVAGPGPGAPRPPDQGAPPQGRPDLQLPAEPVQPAPEPGQPATEPGEAPPRPRLVGQVQSTSAETITLDTPRGARSFRMDPNVQVFRVVQGGEEPASLADVIPGEHLAVFGRIEENGSPPLIAVRLVLLPPPPEEAEPKPQAGAD